MIKRLAVILLLITFLISGCHQELPETTEVIPTENSSEIKPIVVSESKPEINTELTPAPEEQIVPPESTDPLPEEKTPAPEKIENTCSLSVKCDAVLNNMENLADGKEVFIPENGIIFINEKAIIYDGETVFNVLSRELKKNNIHFEFSKTPAYNSMYIEGIGNLYEFDCGDLSGWLYKVNGKTPDISCSQYEVNAGDIIEFYYSCGISIGLT